MSIYSYSLETEDLLNVPSSQFEIAAFRANKAWFNALSCKWLARRATTAARMPWSRFVKNVHFPWLSARCYFVGCKRKILYALFFSNSVSTWRTLKANSLTSTSPASGKYPMRCMEKYDCSVFNRGENYTALLPTASSLPRTTPLSKSTLAMLTPRAALPTPSAPTLSAVLSVAKPRLMTPSTAWPRKTAVSVLNHKVAKVTSNADFNFLDLKNVFSYQQ